MPYEFFLSYARSNNDAYLIEFFEALSDQVRQLRGLPKSQPVGFFDQREEQLGDDWDATVVDAIQTSSVLIALTSPGYFKSVSGLKEWALFEQRAALGTSASGTLPPVVKPLVWVPCKLAEVPAELAKRHFTLGDPDAVQNTRGIRYMLRQLQEHKAAFIDLVDALANEIVQAADAHPLPRLGTVLRLADVPVPGRVTARPLAAAATAPSRSPIGPKHVRFVYVAANPQSFGQARTAAPYVDVGGGDWKPFYPDHTARIHRFVQNIVANDDLDFTSDELTFDANLIAEIDEAWRRRQIVVLIIDGWSVYWSQQYRDWLSKLDQRLDYHWCALIPWNEKDQDSVNNRALIDTALRDAFGKHQFLNNPLFYRSGIKSSDELTVALREVLVRLKEEIKKMAPVDRPVPSGPSKSLVTGPAEPR